MIHDALVPEPVPVKRLQDELDGLQITAEGKFICLADEGVEHRVLCLSDGFGKVGVTHHVSFDDCMTCAEQLRRVVSAFTGLKIGEVPSASVEVVKDSGHPSSVEPPLTEAEMYAKWPDKWKDGPGVVGCACGYEFYDMPHCSCCGCWEVP